MFQALKGQFINCQRTLLLLLTNLLNKLIGKAQSFLG